MKKLLALLFSLFFLSSPSVFADDISDFTIEGISIGDSLLDYMTEDEILEQIKLHKGRYSYLKEPNKYLHISLFKDFPTYDTLYVFIKNNSSNQYITNINEQFKILSVNGYISFTENFEGCVQKMDEISEIFSGMFPSAHRDKWKSKHHADPSGKSIVETIYFSLSSGEEINLQCINLEETFRVKKNWLEGLGVGIDTSEIISWLSDYK